jgi:hypothetical protein
LGYRNVFGYRQELRIRRSGRHHRRHLDGLQVVRHRVRHEGHVIAIVLGRFRLRSALGRRKGVASLPTRCTR